MKLSAPIYILKRRAKLLSRQTRMPLSRALNKIAKDEGHENWSQLVAFNSTSNPKMKPEEPKSNTGVKPTQITKLPLEKEDRAEFIETANAAFENILNRIEAENPEKTRELWDAEFYVDNDLLQDDMLPIDRDYALSLPEAFLVYPVIELAMTADSLVDNEGKQRND